MIFDELITCLDNVPVVIDEKHISENACSPAIDEVRAINLVTIYAISNMHVEMDHHMNVVGPGLPV